MFEFVQKLGLPTKESAVYLALLEFGTANVSTIAAKAHLNRTTCYDILDSLNLKGLVSMVGERTKKTYAAAHPQALVAYFQKQSKRAQRQAEDLTGLLPELRALYTERGKRPRIRFFEGMAGLEAVYEDTLTSSETIRAYASVHNMHAALPHFFPDYYHRRSQKQIAIRAILPATSEGVERAALDKQEMRESVLIPISQFNFSPEINIYDDKVAIMSLAEEFGVIVESKEIAEAEKKIFELAWIGAKQVATGLNKKLKAKPSSKGL